MQHTTDLLLAIAPDLEIQPLDQNLLNAAKNHLDALTKPLGSLGRLEELAMRLYAIYQGRTPISVAPAILYTVAGDHGVAKHHVSAYPQAVTRQMVENFLAGGGGINALCHANGLTLALVDAGCVGGPYPWHTLLLDKRLGDGTEDMTVCPAMSRETALTGLAHGVNLARDASLDGCQCLATGEMGIGNTTSATALFAAIKKLDVAAITGPGTGISGKQLLHKQAVIKKALDCHADTLANGDVIDVLACLGGFEIAIMAGIMLGAAAEHLPILIDGFIAMSACAIAMEIAPSVHDYAIFTHVSAEPGTKRILESLNAHPLLDLGLRLGEGTGAATAYPLLGSAAAIFNEMATFKQANVSNADQYNGA